MIYTYKKIEYRRVQQWGGDTLIRTWDFDHDEEALVITSMEEDSSGALHVYLNDANKTPTLYDVPWLSQVVAYRDDMVAVAPWAPEGGVLKLSYKDGTVLWIHLPDSRPLDFYTVRDRYPHSIRGMEDDFIPFVRVYQTKQEALWPVS